MLATPPPPRLRTPAAAAAAARNCCWSCAWHSPSDLPRFTPRIGGIPSTRITPCHPAAVQIQDPPNPREAVRAHQARLVRLIMLRLCCACAAPVLRLCCTCTAPVLRLCWAVLGCAVPVRRLCCTCTALCRDRAVTVLCQVDCAVIYLQPLQAAVVADLVATVVLFDLSLIWTIFRSKACAM